MNGYREQYLLRLSGRREALARVDRVLDTIASAASLPGLDAFTLWLQGYRAEMADSLSAEGISGEIERLRLMEADTYIHELTPRPT